MKRVLNAFERHGFIGMFRAVARKLFGRSCHVIGSQRSYTVFTEFDLDPLSVFEENLGRFVVLQVPITRLRFSPMGYPGATLPSNPFSRTVHQYLSGVVRTYQESELRRHHESWMPRDAREVLGLAFKDKSWLHGMPPLAARLPWEEDPINLSRTRAELDKAIKDALKRYDRSVRRRISAMGLELGGEAECALWGPVSEPFGAFEFERFCRVADSIQQKGFLANGVGDDGPNGYMHSQLLVGTRSWVLRARAKHRLASLEALGFSHVTVAIELLVRREESALWPGVRSGLFSQEEALQVFDRFLDGELSPGCPS